MDHEDERKHLFHKTTHNLPSFWRTDPLMQNTEHSAVKDNDKWDRSADHFRHTVHASFLDFRASINRLVHHSKYTFFQKEVGVITWFELTSFALILAIPIILTAVSSKTDSGNITSYMILISVIVAIKMNILQFALGVSWERAILFHKTFGTASLACAAIHGIPQLASIGSGLTTDTKAWSGLAMLLALGVQPFLYICLKPYFFELFYFAHLTLYAIIVAFAIIHGATFVWVSVIIFAADLAIRYIMSSRRVMLTAEAKEGDVVQLTFDKKFNHRPGQYAFLMIPALGVLEWHPFTISSAPHEEQMTLHVSRQGDWTGRLAEKVKAGPQQLVGFIEGPYGIPSVNLEDSTYQIVVLISGGVGVTPHQAIANHLLRAHERGRPLKKIVYVWSLRDPRMGLVNTMLDGGQLPRNRALGMGSVGKKATDDADDLSATPGVLHTELYCTQNPNEGEPPAALMAPRNNAVVPLSVNGTDGKDLERSAVADVELRNGRPDFPRLMQREKALAVACGERRVAVSVCGPEGMVGSVVEAVRNATSSEVQIDLHVELFRL